MVNNRRSDVFWAFLLAAALSFGGIGCITSGFVLKDVDLLAMLPICLAVSLCLSLLCCYRRGILIAAAVAVAVLLLKRQQLEDAFEVLLYLISSALNRGYGWRVICWSTEYPTGSPAFALGAIACVVSLTVAWTVVRQKKATVAAIVAFLPMMVCLMLTDTVPDNEYLMLMLGGLVLLALTNPLRCINAQQANRATAMLLVPIILVTMGLFQIVPRENYTPNQSAFNQLEQWLQKIPLWQQLTGQGPSWSMGDSGADHVSLDTLVGKSDSNQVAFYVTSDKSGYLYLRGRGYDAYDGRSWTASKHSSGVDSGWSWNRSRGHRVTIRMDHAREFYYFPGECGPKDLASTFEYGMLENPERETTYTFHWGTPWNGASISEEVRRQCLQLPDETAAWAKQTLKELSPDVLLSSNTMRIAIQIADMVRGRAQYSLDPSRMPLGETDFAKWFYTEAEAGYCVHFATTATVLLRAAGIPARYVTGYAMDVTTGSEIAVPQSRAHAWVEYFVENYGWRILDPTPGYNDPTLPTEPTTEPSEETTAPTQPSSRPTETTQPSSRPTETTPDGTEQTAPSASQPDTPLRPKPGTQEESDIAGKITAVVLWLLAICTAVWGQYRLRICIRRWYARRGSANEQALARWRSVCIRSRIFRQRPPERLRLLAEKAKFSQHILTAEELNEFDLHMAALAATLQEKPWLLRWLLRLCWAIE